MATGQVPGSGRKGHSAGSADRRRRSSWQGAAKPWRQVRLEERRGFLLLELMVALALLGIFLVSLCTGLAALKARAGNLDEAWQNTCVGGGPDSQTSASWTWGPRIVDARWQAESLAEGVVLQLLVASPEDLDGQSEAIVGLWIEGWLLAEMSADGGLMDVGSSRASSPGVTSSSVSSAQTLRLDSSFWEGHEGRELVVRVRGEGGAWGPPWRTFVPGCEDGACTEAMGASQTGGTEVVIHVPRLGTARGQVAVDGHAVSVSEVGPPLIYAAELTGRWTSRLEDAVQAWRGERGRSLDVYY